MKFSRLPLGPRKHTQAYPLHCAGTDELLCKVEPVLLVLECMLMTHCVLGHRKRAQSGKSEMRYHFHRIPSTHRWLIFSLFILRNWIDEICDFLTPP